MTTPTSTLGIVISDCFDRVLRVAHNNEKKL